MTDDRSRPRAQSKNLVTHVAKIVETTSEQVLVACVAGKLTWSWYSIAAGAQGLQRDRRAGSTGTQGVS